MLVKKQDLGGASPSPWRDVMWKFALFAMLGACATLPVAMLRLDVQVFGNGVSESGAVENTQLLLLGVCIAALTVLAKVAPADKRFAMLAAAFFGCMFVRECDFFLNEMVPYCWQGIVAVLSVSALIYAARDARQTAMTGLRFLRTDGGALVIPGLVVLLIYSRLMGMQDIWIQLLEGGYARSVKNAIEETTELMGYSVISFSVVLGVIQRVAAVRRKNAAQSMPNVSQESARTEALQARASYVVGTGAQGASTYESERSQTSVAGR